MNLQHYSFMTPSAQSENRLPRCILAECVRNASPGGAPAADRAPRLASDRERSKAHQSGRGPSTLS
jgi:hypothetical protein